jgi:hypothetical protein
MGARVRSFGIDETTRAIEVDPPDVRLSVALHEAGLRHYLGLARSERLPALRASGAPTAERFTAWRDPVEAVRNDTDLLVYRGTTGRYLWAFPRYRRARAVAIELSPSPHLLATLFATAVFTVFGLVVPAELVRVGGTRLLVLRVRRRARRQSVRRYASPLSGYLGVLRELTQRGGSWSALRWFEDEELVGRAPDEDLDVLVSDETLPVLERVLRAEPGTLPVDAYTVSGLRGSAYRGMAYYPPELAAGVLERAVTRPNGLRIPAPEDHYHTLVYHALYHKGTTSGLRSTLPGVAREANPEHDYEAEISQLAASLDLHVELDLESLDEHLDARGWRPPLDTLARLAPWNPWVRARFFPDDTETTDRDLTAFILRERVLDDGTVAQALAELEAFGFQVIRTDELSEERREDAGRRIRGGNWSAGPYPTSGGLPAVTVVAYDPHPLTVPDHLRSKYPQLANLRTLAAKIHVRDALNADLPADRRCNPLHSSDNGEHAWDYLEVLLPGERDTLRTALDRARQRRVQVHSRALTRRVHVLAGSSGLAAARRRAQAASLRRIGHLLARVEQLFVPTR